MKLEMEIGKLTIPAGQNTQAGTLPVVGRNAFGNLFDGALTLKAGDGSKKTMTKNAAFSEGGNYSAHTDT